MSTETAIPGTIKRTSGGALVAQVEWHRAESLREGQTITVGDTTAAITGIGRRFRAGPYAYAYVYLDEPRAAAPAAQPAPAPAPSCWRCGGQAGVIERTYLPGPDDGGDVAGQTPAGWYFLHTDEAACVAHRTAQMAARRDTLAEWVATAEPEAVVDVVEGHDTWGNPIVPQPRTYGGIAVLTVRQPYPLAPLVYRPRPDGRYDRLGALPRRV